MEQEVYKIEWASKDNPNIILEAIKGNYEEAIKFQDGLSDALVFRLVKTGEKAYQWQLVPTENGKSMIMGIKARRKLKKRGRLINREGVSSLSLRTIPEFQKSQKVRAIGFIAVPAVTIYAGTRKDLPMWLRVSLMTVGVCSAYINGLNYISNKRLEKEALKSTKS